MHTEIESAVNFLINCLSKTLTNLTEEQFNILKKRLNELLAQRFDNHWYPEKPMKGSAYRCVNISIDDGSVDSVLCKAGEEVGITKKDLISAFPKGLALWVDPNDVSCRIGKFGAIFPISRKITEPKPQISYNALPTVQRRPQQRPRSISPPTFQHYPNNFQQQKQRSTTPPGFSSLDPTQMYQKPTKKNYSIENLHKLWDSIPNTSSTYSSPKYQPASYSSPRTYEQKDTVYSFNQYSSYYPSGSLWKKNNNSGSKQYKQVWQDNETYNKYHWARTDRSSASTSTYNGFSNLSYGYQPNRYAQEVC